MSIYSPAQTAPRMSIIISWLFERTTARRQSLTLDTDPELQRLADTSPHLLADIGFRELADGNWCNGRQRIRPKASSTAAQPLHARGSRA